jgi:DNA-binding response OmpR family regulator
MHVLIVEDDPLIAENLFDFLESRGHRCDYAHTVAAARLLLGHTTFDALVLDRNLPDGDGATLARQLRAAGIATPVLMLTARDALEDKLAGFDAGADDYLGKPFALKEVEVRHLALQRRAGAWAASGRLAWGGLTYEPAARAATLDGSALPLPPKALRLLEVLLQEPERVYSRRELETAVWGHEQESSDNLRSVLLTLRKALAAQPALSVENVHGLGYKLTRSR